MELNFKGIQYRLADYWFQHIDLNNFKDRPINYLEIGAFYGANLLSVEKTYGSHPDSKLYCIDPWEDYNEYKEYKGTISNVYNTFIENIENSGKKEKFVISRGYSNNEIPKFQDNFFDIIYIDGNHETNFVLEDAILSFRKLKSNGMMIFDDYKWDTVRKGIEEFINSYEKKISFKIYDEQVFIRKLE